jgi:hypothetical protein
MSRVSDGAPSAGIEPGSDDGIVAGPALVTRRPTRICMTL